MDYDELIEHEESLGKYLLKKMDGGELAAFEKVLAENPRLMKELIDRKSIQFVSKNKLYFELDEKLKKVIDDSKLNLDGDSFWDTWKFTIFSIIFTFGVVGFSYTMLATKNRNKNAYKKLVLEQVEPYENIFNVASDSNSDLHKGMILYEEKKYEEAIHFLEQYLNKEVREEEKDYVKFYLATCYMFEGEKEKAEQLFLPLLKQNFELKKEIRGYPLN